jgi:hypothetical protein
MDSVEDKKNQELCKKFIKGLLKFDIIYDDNFKQNFRYVGSNQKYDESFLETLYGCTRFFTEFPNRNVLPTHKTKCICQTNIIINCYIYNEEIDKILIIGKCCAKTFIDNTLFKYKCIKCNIVKRKSKDTFCKDCKSNWRECIGCKKIIDKRYVNCFKCHSKSLNSCNYVRELAGLESIKIKVPVPKYINQLSDLDYGLN